MSTDGPTEKIPTTPAGGAGPEVTSATTAYPELSAPAEPLLDLDEPRTDTHPGGSTASPEQSPVRRGVRVGTFVWGLVIVAVGIGVLALSAGYTLDVELALIVLLGVAGAAMLIGSLLKGRRGGGR